MQAAIEGSPTILVVDDEELMRQMVTIMIEENGGKVLSAEDGLKGVELFSAYQNLIDLAFIDYSMPRMNGYECFLELRKIKPSIGVIIVSGLSIVPEVEALCREQEIEFLSKPFREVELLKIIRTLQLKQAERAGASLP